MLAEVRGADGYPLQYRVWPCVSGAPSGVLMLLNGVMSHSAWFEPIAGPLAARGLKLVGADRRGTGTNRQGRGDAPSARALIDDLRAIVEAERLPGVPLHLAGWCWGAVLGVNAAFELAPAFTSLAILAPGLFSRPALEARMRESLARAAGEPEDAACLESPIIEELFTRGPALSGFVLQDTLRLSRITPRFHAIMVKMGMSARIRLTRLSLPVALILAEGDEATDNEATLQAFERLPEGQRTLFRIESAHGIQFDAPARLAEALAMFVGAPPAGPAPPGALGAPPGSPGPAGSPGRQP